MNKNYYVFNPSKSPLNRGDFMINTYTNEISCSGSCQQ